MLDVGSTLFIVGGLDDIAGVTLCDEFSDCAATEKRDVVRMWLNGSEHLALMGLPCYRSLDSDIPEFRFFYFLWVVDIVPSSILRGSDGQYS